MCSDLDSDSYLKGQGHTRHLKVRIYMLVSALLLMYALMDYHLTWCKFWPHWDNVHWSWLGSIPQRSRSQGTFKGQSTHACVHTIPYICIDWLPSSLVQMLSLLRLCAYIQECLGYQSNNLYFLFSHSWPVVMYNFGQVQCTSQVERKTIFLEKTMAGDIAFGLPCFFTTHDLNICRYYGYYIAFC